MYEKVRRYVGDELLSGDDEDLDGSTRLMETGIIDSMTMIELIAYIEKTFALKIPESHVNPEAFATLDAVTDLVVALARNPAP